MNADVIADVNADADVKKIVRRLLPRTVRRAASARLAAWRSAALRRRLSSLAASGRPILAGPWLGEVGFELLYWIPFLRWCAQEFGIAPERLTVVSRGGVAGWYAPFAGTYHDVFDYVDAERFRRAHDERVRDAGEQKQVHVPAFERELLDAVIQRAGADAPALLHPSSMYALLGPFWWMHLDERWVHRHASYERFVPPAPLEPPDLPASYVAVKFYFNDCFRDTPRNRDFVRGTVRRLAERTAVVPLMTGLGLDDHRECAVDGRGVIAPPPMPDARSNLRVQSAIVARASAFIGNYGGFSYLAPFYGVRSIAYYDDARGFSQRHLDMARSALGEVGGVGLLDVRQVQEPMLGQDY